MVELPSVQSSGDGNQGPSRIRAPERKEWLTLLVRRWESRLWILHRMGRFWRHWLHRSLFRLGGKRSTLSLQMEIVSMRVGVIAVVAATILTGNGRAAPMRHPQAEAQALDLAKKAIALRSVRGPGNQTPQVATLYRAALVAGGFAEQDVTITRVDDTAYLIARWRGDDPKLKPFVISGHMDVVEANPADWQRDPFTPVVEKGYLFGRGATDMKLDGTLAIAALIELKRSGYKPHRDIVIEFS